MAVQLTIDIFSGRPNPVLRIPPEAALALFPFTPLPPEVALSTRRELPRLGYRGLLLEHDEPGLAGSLPASSRIFRGALRSQNSAVGVNRLLERALFAPGGLAEQSGIPPALRQYIASQAERTEGGISPASLRTPPVREAAVSLPGSEQAPIFEPDWWNDGGVKQSRNNCYNYSTNYRTDTFAQPGLAAGFTISAISCAQIGPFAAADSLIGDPINNNEFPAEGHLVALVMAPGFDFHWYRKGPDGMWSHKIGPEPVVDVDNSGAPIADPRNADRGPYTNFCGFMVVMDGHIKLA